jgi:RNA polymerase sigma-70 factor (ECF subfamily)
MLEAIDPGRQATSSESYRDEAVDDCSRERFVRDAMPYSDYLLRHAWHLTKQRVDAEDLLQDTMLKAYLSFGRFRDGSNLRAWLYRIMVNTWVDRYRSCQRRPTEQLSAEITDAQMLGHAIHAYPGPPSPEAEVLKSVPDNASRALRTLPTDLRATIYYADIEGYRNTEIAELLRIPVGTVASRLHRGRIRLREILIDAAENR